MARSFIVALAVLAILPALALALGADFSRDQLKTTGVFAGQVPVHGYWVNWEDQFFYAGDSKAFNTFAEAYGKFKNVDLKVVIHPGTAKASSPWDAQPRDVPIDWSLYVWNTGAGLDADSAPPGKPAPTRLDVWIGGQVRLEDLRIPAQVTVEAAPGVAADSAIAKYVAERKPAK